MILDVQNDPALFLAMTLNITLLELPCPMLEVAWINSLEMMDKPLDLGDLNFTVLEGEQARPYDPSKPLSLDQLVASLAKPSRCRVSGMLTLPKTPGMLKFSASKELLYEVKGRGVAFREGVRYVLHSLMFGERHPLYNKYEHKHADWINKYLQTFYVDKPNEILQDLS